MMASVLPPDDLATLDAPSSDIDLPGYEILGELGRGGMGVVYKARSLSLDRIVAIKMLPSADYASPKDLERFHTEAQSLACLHHPNIIQIYDSGEYQGRPYFAVEFCAGGSLADRTEPMRPIEAATLVEKLATAIHAAHLAGIVHCDIKPANVLLSGASVGRDLGDIPDVNSLAGFIPKLTDFGVAKLAGHNESGAILGTPSYMAPEQASGSNDIGPGADVYGLGALLYSLLVSRPPFLAPSSFDTLVQVVGMDPMPPRQLDANIPVDLETICLKCLEKRPENRYASAEELARDLLRFLEEIPVRARPASRFTRLVKFGVRNPLIAAMLYLGLVVGSVVFRTFLSLDADTRRALFDVVSDFAWNSALTALLILVGVSVYGVIRHVRHRSGVAETVWRCVLLWLVGVVLANLIIPLL